MIDGLTEYEQKLREGIAARLRSRVGRDWAKHFVAEKMLGDWQKWAERDLKRKPGSEEGELLICFASLGDLISLVVRQWPDLGDLAGGDQQRFNALAGILKQARDTAAHSRPVTDTQRQLAEAACRWLTEVLRTTSAPSLRTVLTKAVDQFGHPDYGYGASSDLLDDVWEQRNALGLTSEDAAFLVQSEDMNRTGKAVRWLDFVGLDVLLFARIIVSNCLRLHWVAAKARRSAPNAGLGVSIEWMLRRFPLRLALKSILSAQSVVPLTYASDAQELAKTLSSIALEYAVGDLVERWLVTCNKHGCRRVMGYDDEPDANGIRVILEQEGRPCHISRSRNGGRPRLAYHCRLKSFTHLGDELNGAFPAKHLQPALRALQLAVTALSETPQERRDVDVAGQWVAAPTGSTRRRRRDRTTTERRAS